MDAKEALSIARSEAEKVALGRAILYIQQAAKDGATSLVLEVPELARKYVHTELKALGYGVRFSGKDVLVRWDLC